MSRFGAPERLVLSLLRKREAGVLIGVFFEGLDR